MTASRHAAAAAGRGGLKRVAANLGHLVGGKAAGGIMSLVYLVIVARTLGARDYGVLTLVSGYALFVGSIVAFSGFHGVVRYGAVALRHGDRDRLAAIIRFMTVVELGCGAIAVAAAAISAPIVGPRLGWTPDAMRFAVPFALAVIGTVRATPQGVLQIAGRFDLIGLHQMTSPVVRLIGSLGIWVFGGGLSAFLTVWLASSIAEGVAMWLLAWPSWRQLTEGARLRGRWRGIGRDDGFGSFIVTANFDITLRELAPNLAPLTVGWMLGPAAAGVFSLAQRATALLRQPAVLLAQASYSVLAGQVADGAFGTLRATVWRSAGIAVAASAPFVLAFGLAGDRLAWLVGGRSFDGAGMLIVTIAAARAIQLVSTPFGAGLTALGLPQRSMTVTLVSNLALYPLLPLLIAWIGVDGAGWHALGQALFATLVLAAMFARDARDGNGAPPRSSP